jgi:hypothetical protein
VREGEGYIYREYVIPVVIMVYINMNLYKEVEREFGINLGDIVGY